MLMARYLSALALLTLLSSCGLIHHLPHAPRDGSIQPRLVTMKVGERKRILSIGLVLMSSPGAQYLVQSKHPEIVDVETGPSVNSNHAWIKAFRPGETQILYAPFAGDGGRFTRVRVTK